MEFGLAAGVLAAVGPIAVAVVFPAPLARFAERVWRWAVDVAPMFQIAFLNDREKAYPVAAMRLAFTLDGPSLLAATAVGLARNGAPPSAELLLGAMVGFIGGFIACLIRLAKTPRP